MPALLVDLYIYIYIFIYFFYFSGFPNYLKWYYYFVETGWELELNFSCVVELLDLDLRTDIDQVDKNGSKYRKGIG